MTRDAPPDIVRINPPELGTPPGYSQVVEVSSGRIIFIAGQTAVDADGNVVGKDDFAAIRKEADFSPEDANVTFYLGKDSAGAISGVVLFPQVQSPPADTVAVRAADSRVASQGGHP